LESKDVVCLSRTVFKCELVVGSSSVMAKCQSRERDVRRYIYSTESANERGDIPPLVRLHRNEKRTIEAWGGGKNLHLVIHREHM
jgi:hypothetical protein